MVQPASAKKDDKASLRTENDTTPGEILRDELLDTLLDYKPKSTNEGKDTLEGRYRIHLDQPLPEFNTELAKAYHAVDEQVLDRSLYALVCSRDMPVRQKLAKAMKNISHPHLIQLAASGVVELSSPAEQRYVIIYEKPRGKSLTALLAEQNRQLPDNFIIEHIIAPLASALYCLEEIRQSHGRINPNNIYFGDHVVLGECVSEPCGYSQDYRFESVPRMQAAPAGKGDGFVSEDYFSLGALVAWLKFGPGIFSGYDRESYLRRLLQEGSYHALVGNRNVSDQMSDFLRGTLNDNPFERWKYQAIKPWTTGKRYNLLPPGVSNAASRSFAFEGADYSNFQSISHALYQHWSVAASVLRDASLSRWAELSARRKDTAEAIMRSVKSLGGDIGRNERQNSELIARCLTIIDPNAPLRMKEVSAHIDGIGTLMADYFRGTNEQALQHISDIIEQGLANVWGEQQRHIWEDNVPQELTAALWNVERVRLLMRTPGFGFGMERCLYEMNPDLPCLSPLLAGYYVTTLPQLLAALDVLAVKKSRDEDPFDRHIAAFIASRVGLMQEVILDEFKHIPAIYKDKSLVTLRLLEAAQKKSGHPKLPGLSLWVASCVTVVLDHLHSRSLSKHISKVLKNVGANGYLTPIAETIFHPDYVAADQEGFEQAAYQYAAINMQIEQMNDENYRYAHALEWGHSLARFIAYAIFMAVLVMVSHGRVGV